MLCGEQALDMFKSLIKINTVKVINYLILGSTSKIYRNFTLLSCPIKENNYDINDITIIFILNKFNVNLLYDWCIR
jgi:hypothetical protein